MAKFKIGLDAGHGLKTAGKRTPDGIKENYLNDIVCDKITALLKDYDVEIIRTDNNEGNVDEALSTRLKTYINAKVDAFVSIHHNALNGKWGTHTGVEVWTDINPTSKDTALAKAIYAKLPSYTGLKGRGIKQEDWYVINQDSIPAVLCEGGFMDSSIDYKVITSDAGQNGYAKAVAEGLILFLGIPKKTSVSPSSSPTTSSAVKVGDTVSIKTGAKYYNGGTIPAWVIKLQWIVSEVSGDRAVINKSTDGKHSINSPINIKYLTVVKKNSNSVSSSKSFQVQVTIADLNIRTGPGTNYAKTGKYTGKGVFTITEVKSGPGSDAGWGKLKSGAGWISLDFAKRV